MVSQGRDQDLWIYDLQRGARNRLATGQNSFPRFSPDGRFLVFQAFGGIFWARTDGSGKPEPLLRGNAITPFSFTPDGARLVYAERVSDAEAEIRTVPVESNARILQAGEPRLFLKTSTVNAYACFSPDGRWLAYADTEGGRYEVYVRAGRSWIQSLVVRPNG